MGAYSTKAIGAGMQYRDCSTPCHTRASASSAAAGAWARSARSASTDARSFLTPNPLHLVTYPLLYAPDHLIT